jgi:hypothetical protein
MSSTRRRRPQRPACSPRPRSSLATLHTTGRESELRPTTSSIQINSQPYKLRHRNNSSQVRCFEGQRKDGPFSTMTWLRGGMFHTNPLRRARFVVMARASSSPLQAPHPQALLTVLPNFKRFLYSSLFSVPALPFDNRCVHGEETRSSSSLVTIFSNCWQVLDSK